MMQKMSCSDVAQRYTEYTDRSLDSSEMALMETHLTGCSTCRTLFQQLDQITQKLHTLPPVTTSNHFNDRLMDRIHQETQSISTWRKIYSAPVMRVGGYAAAAGLAIALLFTQWMEPNNLTPGAPVQMTREQALSAEPPALAGGGADSLLSPEQDSLGLRNPSAIIEGQNLQLVNEKR